MKAKKDNNKDTSLSRICEDLYSLVGPSAVYAFALTVKLKSDNCIPCDAFTPTITENSHSTCALCGSNKILN